MRNAVEDLKARLALPVIAAPMFLVSGPDMVIEACRNGVMGAFPAPNARTEDDLRAWFDRITGALTPADAPWAFNMITHSSYGRFDAEIALVEEYRPGIVVTALGGPHRVTRQVHGYGGLVFADVNSPSFAKKALDKGADGLVLVCAGAGGHTGTYAIVPFIEEVRRFFDGPIAVGGGIGTGAAVRAVETLGADFAYLGTRILTARETLIPEAYRQMVWQSRMEDLIASKAISGARGLWMKASVTAAGMSMEDRKAEKKIDFSQDMHSDAKAWKTVWSAGQGIGGLTRPETMAQIVAGLSREYAAAVAAQAKGSRYVTPRAEAAE